ncbi:MAG: ATP-grasp domain-containing protein [Eubacteriaceae bacterium]|jgi:biotin carboxylase|nr:ATP-grasp domain-containing protein [Eubacteriaceae bacterium]
MNYIFISPHFPDNFQNFVFRLNEKGVKVLGIGDTPYEGLTQELRDALTEYYRVDSLENYDEVLKACGFFTHKYGKIDRIESQNEHWLELDAALRTDFNVSGFKNEDMDRIKAKSAMKEVYRQIGIPVAEGRVFTGQDDAKLLAKELGYPVCIKPNIGVGALDTHNIQNGEELAHFFRDREDQLITGDRIPYIMEAYVDGDIVTFDGLTDRDGNVVFMSTLIYDKPVLDIIEDDTDMYYYIPRDIPKDLEEAGKKCVEAFNVKERFFHFEFFRLKDTGQLVGLEVNCRPPGGMTMDMFNYANDIDMYSEYANIVLGEDFSAPITRPYYCCYIARKHRRHYVHSREDIDHNYGEYILSNVEMPDIFSAVMGNYGYLFRCETEEKMMEIIDYISRLEEENH